MRILLIDPPFHRFTGFVNFYFPMGLTQVGAALQDAGHDVAIFDSDAVSKGENLAGYEYERLQRYREGLNDPAHPVWRELVEVCRRFRPDMVGITAITTKFGSVLRTAELLRERFPGLMIVAGGPHATLMPDQTLQCQAIDLVVVGEGERTITQVVHAIEMGAGFEHVRGIQYRHEGKMRRNRERPMIEDLDQCAPPARECLMDPEGYSSADMGAVLTSRGCPFQCSYCCHLWTRKVRNRSVDNVIDEIKAVMKYHGSRQFDFKDDTFTLNRKRTVEICDRIISERLKINWSCSTRANLLDADLLKQMKRAGCNLVKLGIETGSQKILEETDKGVTFEHMRTAARLLNREGVFWSGYFMIGLPTETEEDMRLTYRFMKELNPYYAALGVYNPFPKTALFDRGVELGLLQEDVELSHFFDTHPKDYYFIDPQRRVVTMDHERYTGIVDWMMEKFHEHNKKLSNLVRRGWSRRRAYAHDRRLLLGDMKKAIKWIGVK